MITETALLVLVAVGGVASLVWMLEHRVYATGVVSGGAWGLVALTAADVQAYTLSGATYQYSGWMLQALGAFLAALSFLAIVAAYFGHYPPTETKTQ